VRESERARERARAQEREREKERKREREKERKREREKERERERDVPRRQRSSEYRVYATLPRIVSRQTSFSLPLLSVQNSSQCSGLYSRIVEYD